MTGKETIVNSFGQCALLQDKTIITAFHQLLNNLNGKSNTPRKPITSKRPHPTCSHRTPSPCTCQISHLTHKSSSSCTVFNLQADIASNGHTSFHTMLQMVTKHGCKPIPVKIDTGAEINTVPLSKYKKLFPAHVIKSGNLESKALHPTTNTCTLPQILLSYAVSIRLGIIEFKVPNKAPAKALDAITHHKKCVTFSNPLHSHTRMKTKHKDQCHNSPLKPVIKLNFFQNHHYPDYSSKTSHFRTIFHKNQHFSSFPPKMSHYKTIFDQSHCISSVLHKINYSRTIPHKTCHPAIVFQKISYFRTILHQQCYPNNNPLKFNHFKTISLLIMFATSQL